MAREFGRGLAKFTAIPYASPFRLRQSATAALQSAMIGSPIGAEPLLWVGPHIPSLFA
jgi:hypothetical protein